MARIRKIEARTVSGPFAPAGNTYDAAATRYQISTTANGSTHTSTYPTASEFAAGLLAAGIPTTAWAHGVWVADATTYRFNSVGRVVEPIAPMVKLTQNGAGGSAPAPTTQETKMSEPTTTCEHVFDYNVLPNDGYCRKCNQAESALTPNQETEMDETTTPEAPVATALEQALAAGRKPKNQLGSCECAAWEIGLTTDRGDGEEPDVTIETTGCNKQTKRMFAQGHDAKLKSLFIKAGVEGWEVRFGRAAGVLVTTDAEGAAKRFGFERQVLDGIRNRLDKLARKGARIAPAPRVADDEGDPLAEPEAGLEIARGALAIPQAPAEQDDWTEAEQAETDELLAGATGADEPATIQGKIGRWVYEGTENEDGSFTYKSANGETKTAPAGKWGRNPR